MHLLCPILTFWKNCATFLWWTSGRSSRVLRNSLQPAIQVVNEWCFRYSLLKCVEFAASFQLNGCPFLRSFSFSILIFFSRPSGAGLWFLQCFGSWFVWAQVAKAEDYLEATKEAGLIICMKVCLPCSKVSSCLWLCFLYYSCLISAFRE